MASKKEFWAVGRRKNAIARVKLKEGSGKIIVNKKDITEYLRNQQAYIDEALRPLSTVGAKDKVDLLFNVRGGGPHGQVGALRHAVARVLCEYNSDFRPNLKKEGFLTRDARMVERKKYGLHKARKGTQFSKR